MMLVATVVLVVVCALSSVFGLGLLAFVAVKRRDNLGRYYHPVITILAIAITSGVCLLAILTLDSFGS